jgi:AraC family transcriptional regulator of adaptative response/methylated-DNA-[protein]-cysteine methyltransferase
MIALKSRQAGSREVLHFTTAPSSLGTVLVATSSKGVCALLLGDDPAELEAELQRRFPKAALSRGGETTLAVATRAIRHVEDPAARWDLPLDLRGTAFQKLVWQALRDIPSASTDSYTGIARKIGRPAAVRAVAGACAANPVAVAVPCHRVLRRDGDLSGYRWGIDRKRALLDRESNA